MFGTGKCICSWTMTADTFLVYFELSRVWQLQITSYFCHMKSQHWSKWWLFLNVLYVPVQVLTKFHISIILRFIFQAFQHPEHSGGARVVKEPGHFKVRKSSSQVTWMHFFPQKSWRPFFSHCPQNTGHQCRFIVKIKQIKRSDMVTFFKFSVHTITEAKQYTGLGRTEPGLEPGWWIFKPGHLTWHSPV